MCVHIYAQYAIYLICTDIPLYTRTYVRTYVHQLIHIYIHTYIHTCMHACMHTSMHACITYMHANIHALHTSSCIPICMWKMYECACVYMDICICSPHDPYLCVLLVWIVGGGMHQNTAMLKKITKFWGMSCTKHCNARKKTQTSQKIVIYSPQACIVYKSLGCLGFFEHDSVWCNSCPKTLQFFEHCGV